MERYLALPDASYSWRDTGVRFSGVDNASGVAWTGHVLNMTSLTWTTEMRPLNPVWWHTLVVIVPENLEFNDWATIFLEAGIDNESGVTSIANRASGDEDVVLTSENLEAELPQLSRAVYKSAYV